MFRSGFTLVFSGPAFQPAAFLTGSSLQPLASHIDESLEFADIHAGTFPHDAATEALDLLRAHRTEFLRLAHFPGVVTRTLNFFGNADTCSMELEPADVALLHELSLHLSISVYAHSPGVA